MSAYSGADINLLDGVRLLAKPQEHRQERDCTLFVVVLH